MMNSKLLSNSIHSAGKPWTFEGYCSNAYRYTFETEDYDPLLPYLSSCQDAVPSATLTHYDRNLSETELSEMYQDLEIAGHLGGLDAYYSHPPEVEQWITLHASQIATLFLNAQGMRLEDTKCIFSQLLATSVALHCLTGGLHDYFSTHEGGVKEYSFVATCIHDIRRALEFTIYRHIESAIHERFTEEHAQNVISQLQSKFRDFQQNQLRPEYISSRTQFANVKKCLMDLAQTREECDELLLCTDAYKVLPEFASRIAGEFKEDSDATDEPHERILPWGQITLIRKCQCEEALLYYTSDGVKRETYIALSSTPNSLSHSVAYSPIIPNTDDAILQHNTMGYSLDHQQRVFFSPYDRLAPSPNTDSYQEASRILQAADRALNRELVDLWEQHPEIFSKVPDFGPFTFVQVPEMGKAVLLCRTSSVPEMSPIIGYEPNQRQNTMKLANAAQLEPLRDWSSFTIDITHVPPPEAEPETPDTPQEWRQRIREHVGRKIPNLQWVVDHLTPFGDVQLTPYGKGSHGSVLLISPSRTRRQTIWRTIEGTEAIHWNILWEFLERLGIEYREFYESLKQ